MYSWSGLGAIPTASQLATDAQAATLSSGYAAANAGGNGYSAIQTPTVAVGRMQPNGDLNVLIAVGSSLAYQDIGIVPAAVLSSLGINPATTVNLNQAQTAAVLNAMAGSTGSSASTGASLNLSTIPWYVWAGAAGLIVVMLMGDKR